jgi:SAM-dependent methyltransferase
MEPIHQYIIDLALREKGDQSMVLLDYGCGAGEIVRAANAAGIDAYGVDLFYDGGSYKGQAASSGLLGTRILELANGHIPFGDGTFDVVVSNQVFEHIEDFSQPLEEIHRALRPQGMFINLFPTTEIWREGHIGIPFVHWFSKRSKLRFLYTLFFRSLGVGYHKKSGSLRAWTKYSLDWIDKWTYYKPLADVRDLFEHYFSISDHSDDYLLYRLSQHRWLRLLARFFRPRCFRPLLRFVCHRLSGRVFVLRKLAQ